MRDSIQVSNQIYTILAIQILHARNKMCLYTKSKKNHKKTIILDLYELYVHIFCILIFFILKIYNEFIDGWVKGSSLLKVLEKALMVSR